MKKHERIQKIKESPEWIWYQERLNLIDMGMMRGHISYIVMECLSGKYPEQLQLKTPDADDLLMVRL